MSKASSSTYRVPENKKSRQTQREKILNAIRDYGPIHQDRIVALTGLSAHAVGRRITELHDNGEIHGSAMMQVSSKRYQTIYAEATEEQKALIQRKRHGQKFIKWLKQGQGLLNFMPEDMRKMFVS